MVNLEQFRRYLDQSGLKTFSIESNVRDIGQYYEYLTHQKAMEINRAGAKDVEEYCAFLLQKGLAPVSIQRKLASIKKYYSYLCDMGQAACNPAAGISTRKRSVAKVKLLSDQQLSKLLSLPDTQSISGIRDRAMFALIYSTGVKVSELVSLNIQDINLKEKRLKMRRQSACAAIALDDEVCRCLDAYLALREMLLPKDNDTLFLNVYGRSITRQGVWKTLKKYAESIGISGITLETIRRSFAKKYLDCGNDMESLKDILGHSDISVTRAYVKP